MCHAEQLVQEPLVCKLTMQTASIYPFLRVMLIRMFRDYQLFLGVVLTGLRLSLVLPLLLACLALVVAIPSAARRGKLHVPGYMGLALLTFLIAMLVGHITGIRALNGTLAGVLLSILFFLLIAAAVGSALALFFFRNPHQE
jgi:hypothetical protein